MSNTWPLEKKYLDEFRASRGNQCERPGCEKTEGLEIHHRVPGNVFGRERGSARAYEVRRHPDWHELLCKEHHTESHPGGFRNYTAEDEADRMERDFLRDHPEAIA